MKKHISSSITFSSIATGLWKIYTEFEAETIEDFELASYISTMACRLYMIHTSFQIAISTLVLQSLILSFLDFTVWAKFISLLSVILDEKALKT